MALWVKLLASKSTEFDPWTHVEAEGENQLYTPTPRPVRPHHAHTMHTGTPSLFKCNTDTFLEQQSRLFLYSILTELGAECNQELTWTAQEAAPFAEGCRLLGTLDSAYAWRPAWTFNKGRNETKKDCHSSSQLGCRDCLSTLILAWETVDYTKCRYGGDN